MKLTHLISQHIVETFEGNNWTDVNISDTLHDFAFKEAFITTAASPNSIASLVHHIMFYNYVVLERLNGNNPEIEQTNGFHVPAIQSEEEWQSLQARCHESFRVLANAVIALPEERLSDLAPNSKSTLYKTLQGVVEHAHYHLGQIVILKKLIHKLKDNEISSTW